jgi:hypothetical protein
MLECLLMRGRLQAQGMNPAPENPPIRKNPKAEQPKSGTEENPGRKSVSGSIEGCKTLQTVQKQQSLPT